MADLEGCLLLVATVFDVGGEILGPGSPFPVILRSSSDFSNATELVSYGADPGGLAFLWLSIGLSG